MGIKTRKKIRIKQKVKRHKKRLKLAKQGQNPDDLLFNGTWVGSRASQKS